MALKHKKTVKRRKVATQPKPQAQAKAVPDVVSCVDAKAEETEVQEIVTYLDVEADTYASCL